jgi:hypothetical protein
MASFFDPNLLPWWGWLLCSAGAGIVALVSGALTDEAGDAGCLVSAGGVMAGLVSLLTGATGVILTGSEARCERLLLLLPFCFG